MSPSLGFVEKEGNLSSRELFTNPFVKLSACLLSPESKEVKEIQKRYIPSLYSWRGQCAQCTCKGERRKSCEKE